MIRLAAKHGLAVFLDPIETGGWLGVLRSNGTAKAYDYGRYLGRRYRRFPNIVWLNGNDFQTWRDPQRRRGCVLAVAQGIRATDPRPPADRRARTTRPAARSTTRRWTAHHRARRRLHLLPDVRRGPQGVRSTRTISRCSWSRPTTSSSTPTPARQTLRRQEYWTMLSGATGQLYGNKYTWQFLDGWQTTWTRPASRQMTLRHEALRRTAVVRPGSRQRHRLVIAGYGTFGQRRRQRQRLRHRGSHSGRQAGDRLSADRAVTSPSTCAKLAGRRVRAQWYDPTSGHVHDGPRLAARDWPGGRSAPPGKNDDGDGDWVLVLTAT